MSAKTLIDRVRLGVLASALVLAVQPALRGQDASSVELAQVRIEPEEPAADELCQLAVEVRNQGESTVSMFGFRVRVGGQDLPVYERQLFLRPIGAGESAEIELFNFWTSEQGRPAPQSGPLLIEVELVEASWVEVTTVEEDGEEVEVWRPLGEVDGLPSEQRLSVSLSGAKP